MSLRSIIVFSLMSFLLLSLPAGAQSDPDLQPGLDLFEARKYAEAQEFFERLSPKYPDHAHLAYCMGRSYYQSRQIKASIEFLEKAVELDEKKAEFHYLLGMAYVSYLNDVGMFRKMGLAKKMKKAFFAAVDLDGGHKESQVAVIGFYLNAPGIAGGSLEEGARCLAILKQRYPDEIFPMEALLAEKNEHYEDAERLYRQAYEKNPLPRYLYGLASYMIRREQFDESAKLLKEYLALDVAWSDPSKTYAHYQLGSIFADKKMNAKAKEALQLAKADCQEKFLDEMIDQKMRELNYCPYPR